MPAAASAVPLAVALAVAAGGGLGFLVALSRAYARRGSATRAITSALSRLGGAVGASLPCFLSSASSHFSYSYSCASNIINIIPVATSSLRKQC